MATGAWRATLARKQEILVSQARPADPEAAQAAFAALSRRHAKAFNPR
ncbi:MAG: hypothetical protein WB816_17275 [Methylocystis sp.]